MIHLSILFLAIFSIIMASLTICNLLIKNNLTVVILRITKLAIIIFNILVSLP
jgi:hypothetical protein